ncbi:TPA: phage holin family protein [Yersinia enterocolitica]|uniref:phage holin family protein n=1 Tax=unclassified Yersinia (in: enterobacteria) TaxID=2653513 RepID=UPI00110DF937|nr:MULTISPECIES: phage holin family protein [unclassified Yersinia (in: enterobacteria)]EKN4905618.1 phage holin family protein [Yersinia enterocolitica]MBS0055538.1 phage holin family protein [Yersinia sp. Marseille-Q3913]QDW32295.1 holin [Yersinia sp. KBS0713]HDL7686451.1 phage holin family protein [Yersinia enterocolitica]HDL7790296.1 phage holin family protein [Yersinia enterocolitica]
MKMPEKDPSWIGALLAFYSAHSTVINGFLVGFIVAFRRVVWGGGKLREGIGEGVVCGLVGVNIGPVISPMLIRAIDAIPWLNGALTEVAAGKVEIFISCLIGLIGLQAIRELVFKIVNKKVGTPDAKP